jgi:ketosteroid isomerase-like protein
MASDATRETPAQHMMREHVRYMASDMDRWMAILSDDVLFEFPFGESVGANSLHGKDNIKQAVEAFVGMLEGLRFDDPVFVGLADPDQAIAEYGGVGTVKANGAQYVQRYLVHIRCENGKIVHIREFFDPTRISRAFSAGGQT